MLTDLDNVIFKVLSTWIQYTNVDRQEGVVFDCHGGSDSDNFEVVNKLDVKHNSMLYIVDAWSKAVHVLALRINWYIADRLP